MLNKAPFTYMDTSIRDQHYSVLDNIFWCGAPQRSGSSSITWILMFWLDPVCPAIFLICYDELRFYIGKIILSQLVIWCQKVKTWPRARLCHHAIADSIYISNYITQSICWRSMLKTRKNNMLVCNNLSASAVPHLLCECKANAGIQNIDHMTQMWNLHVNLHSWSLQIIKQ